MQPDHLTESYLKHHIKKHWFLTTVIYKLLRVLSQHCTLNAPQSINKDAHKDVVEGTNYTPFFLDDKTRDKKPLHKCPNEYHN